MPRNGSTLVGPAPTSPWREVAAEHLPAAWEEGIRCEVLVVGAGWTGLTTALRLVERGVDVLVIEADSIGAGTTGGTTGKVTSQHGQTYADLEEEHGVDALHAYAEANAAAVEAVVDTARRFDIDCDLERLPAYTYTTDPDRVPELERETAAARRAGLPASYDEELDLPFPVAGAVRFDDQVQLHPLRYLHGLARVVTAGGGRIVEGVRATGVDGEDPHEVLTDRGSVTADHVVLATRIPFLDRGFEFARAHPVRAYGVALRAPRGGPPGMYLTLDEPRRSFRRHPTPDGDLVVVVGEEHPTGQGPGDRDHDDPLVRFAQEHLGAAEVTHRWSAQDHMPVDGLPYIGPITPSSPRLHVATGLRKWGLTLGVVAAEIISDAIVGRDNRWAPLFDPNRLNLGVSGGALLAENLDVARRFVADRVRVGTDADEVRPGEGTVVRRGARLVAVHRDPEGRVTERSAICPHLGCVVNWNTTEGSWDCPCHGSRFSVDGRVLDGPAVEGLGRIDGDR
jgi:glycine/D-amino acid oxidase-like deaminating enzyme/nitrite reductase/ring-hydroxylating ferredoxin subunit